MSADLQKTIVDYLDLNGVGEGICHTGVDGLTFMRVTRQTFPAHLIYRPELCVVVQGAKSVMLGDEVIDYRAMQALVVSMTLPGVGRVTEASAGRPLLVMRLELDVALLRDVMQQMKHAPRAAADTGLGLYVRDIEAPLADCLLRLVRMLGAPHELPLLLPLLQREIHYRLLAGDHGHRLAALCMPDSHARRISEALALLREHYAAPVPIERLAAAAGMSASSFHHHFKALTSMTPLGYQKQLRLLEAKRLMLAEGVSVMRAAFHVGYESASQFSREYVRMFGHPPRRDVAATRKLYQGHTAAPV
jgi:AraC-like DNA-binding protein